MGYILVCNLWSEEFSLHTVSVLAPRRLQHPRQQSSEQGRKTINRIGRHFRQKGTTLAGKHFSIHTMYYIFMICTMLQQCMQTPILKAFCLLKAARLSIQLRTTSNLHVNRGKTTPISRGIVAHTCMQFSVQDISR